MQRNTDSATEGQTDNVGSIAVPAGAGAGAAVVIIVVIVVVILLIKRRRYILVRCIVFCFKYPANKQTFLKGYWNVLVWF